MSLVLDASITLSWCFRGEQGDYAAHVLRLLANDVAVVPGLWLLEVTNGLLVAERRGRLNARPMLPMCTGFSLNCQSPPMS